MLKNLIILPDGTEIYSGNARDNAIISCQYTQCVNDSTELSIGSCCCNELELKLFAKDGLSIAANDEIQYYKVDDLGNRTKIGVFRCEKPTVTGTGTYKFVAYDNVSKLDKDLTEWLAALDGWPYSVNDFAVMTCEACGVRLASQYSFSIVNGDLVLAYRDAAPLYSLNASGELVLEYSGSVPDVSINSDGYLEGTNNLSLVNGEYQIRQFSADGITGRKIMQWIGQIACRFIRANEDGEIEFAWYTDKGAEITTDGDIRYFGGGLSYEDYQVAEIQKVQIQVTGEDNGTVYPDGLDEEVNTYKITENFLLTAETGDELKPVAQAIYEQLQGVTYTPCKVSIQATTEINAGDIIHVTDRNGVRIAVYVMTKTNSGQKDTLECTGSYSRDSSTATNYESYKAISGKYLNLQKTVDGLKIENGNMYGQIASLNLDIEGIEARVADGETNVTKLQQTAGQVSVEVETETTKLETVINDSEWRAEFSVDGVAKSGLHFDFKAGQFVFDGHIEAASGTIGGWTIDGDTIRTENSSAVLHSGNSGDYIPSGFTDGVSAIRFAAGLGSETTYGYWDKVISELGTYVIKSSGRKIVGLEYVYYNGQNVIDDTGYYAAEIVAGRIMFTPLVEGTYSVKYRCVAEYRFVVADDGTMYCSGGVFNGEVNATSGTFTGAISATSGTIGDWKIEDGSLTATSEKAWVSFHPDYLTAQWNTSNMMARWYYVAVAGKRCYTAEEETVVTIGGKTLTFYDGILQSVSDN